VLITSVAHGPDSPLGSYLRQGFRETGDVHQGELVLELDLGEVTLRWPSRAPQHLSTPKWTGGSSQTMPPDRSTWEWMTLGRSARGYSAAATAQFCGSSDASVGG
jgi:hypothetical protein